MSQLIYSGMKINLPIIKAKEIVIHQTLKLSEKTIEKTEIANNYLTDFADVILFFARFVKETFSRKFEVREFFHQCFLI